MHERLEKPVLIVAFDGLDYELVQRFGLEHLPQKEAGRIDNHTGIAERKTSELFTSFITGETYEQHGVTGLKKPNNQRLHNIRELIPNGVRGSYRLKQVFDAATGYEKEFYAKDDYSQDTIFEKTVSRPIHVPGYNPDPAWRLGYVFELVGKGYSHKSILKQARKQTRNRLHDFYQDYTHDFYDLMMLHLHDPDSIQDVNMAFKENDPEILKDEYERLDGIAGNIQERFSDWNIIFMSDHGRPEKNEHNQQAFYSANFELFGNQEPHITDFHDKILEIVKCEEGAECKKSFQ